ncbi:unnamed protein product [Fusarium fujikuroi]|uniref:Uncharacterized protein n=1 Tax=Fusarium fujikuroi TaxID=5127 RepID=A0A9Q9UEV5_FUSFU|nr:unnamed protein product [Fusarium fujikuroi]VTT78981.1 unnamed protein product [Fusarium fujikuroi]VZI20084.1 unnamed protein product [Fusarium fujikuroi]
MLAIVQWYVADKPVQEACASRQSNCVEMIKSRMGIIIWSSESAKSSLGGYPIISKSKGRAARVSALKPIEPTRQRPSKAGLLPWLQALDAAEFEVAQY